MSIKMRVNNNTNSCCNECGKKYMNTKEMYDLMLCGEKYTLCFDCVDLIFHKTLKSSVMYNNKLKGKTDMERIKRDNMIKNPVVENHEDPKPECYGNFVKKIKCKKCKYLYECRKAFDEQWEDAEND